MANSTQKATSDGTLTLLDLSINYLDRAEIKVYENEVLSTTWAWVGTTDKQIKFTPAVANGVVIQVKRTTDASKLRHEFGGGAAFTAQSLDESLKQILHMSQEGLEIPGFAADMKMNGFRITHVADPVAAQDAATKAWVETTTATSAANAAASAASAAASYDSFDDRYLGPKDVAPTLDNDGAALLTGALYWDTAATVMRAYTGTAWVNLPAATASAVANTPAGSIAATTVQAAIDELDADISNLASTKQQADATLTALAAVVNAADQINYATGPDAFSTTPLTAFARTLLDDADAATARDTLVAQVALQVLHVRDEKADGTSGGDSVVGDQTRVLNTVKTNTITGASLANNKITLPIGTYTIQASAPAYKSSRHRIRLYNVTAAVDAAYGTNAYTIDTSAVVTHSTLNAILSVTTASEFTIIHNIEVALLGNGLGVDATGAGVEVYTTVVITKIG